MAGNGWIGKLVGGVIGLLLSKGSILGALLGVLVGHQFDKGFAGVAGRTKGASGAFGRASGAERQRLFFETVFLAMGHLAKADGRVSEQEIQAARVVMHQWRLSPEDVRAAIDLFSQGKSPDFPLDSQILRLRAACEGQRELIRTFLQILMELPLSNGRISSVERELLWRIASTLGVGRVEMAQLEAILLAQRSFGQGHSAAPGRGSHQDALNRAYKALGVEPDATDKEVKTAYRRLMNQHHPDKLVSRGLPDSMLEVAKERTREIRSAYETIRDHRGMR